MQAINADCLSLLTMAIYL